VTMKEGRDSSSLTINGNILIGRAWIFGDNINTDIIIHFRFKSRTNDPYEMAKCCNYTDR